MKLLIITNNPTRASFRQRVEVHLDLLKAGQITCEVAKFPSGSVARFRLLKRCCDFDAVFLHKKRLNPIDAMWLRKYGRMVIYDFDDAVMYDDKDPGKTSRKRQKSFARTVKLADAVIAGNDYLAEHAKGSNPGVTVLPTGLDVAAYRPEVKRADDGKVRLVWIGSRSTLKYLTDISPALEQVAQRFDNVVLRVICDDFFSLEKMPVEKCTWSLASQCIDLAGGDIGLAPLPDDPFARGKCGFKILQYAASALPVVTSPVGVNADLVRDGVTGYHASDVEEWVDRIGRLVEDRQLRQRMGQANLKMGEDFDLKKIGQRLSEIILPCGGKS